VTTDNVDDEFAALVEGLGSVGQPNIRSMSDDEINEYVTRIRAFFKTGYASHSDETRDSVRLGDALSHFISAQVQTDGSAMSRGTAMLMAAWELGQSGEYPSIEELRALAAGATVCVEFLSQVALSTLQIHGVTLENQDDEELNREAIAPVVMSVWEAWAPLMAQRRAEGLARAAEMDREEGRG